MSIDTQETQRVVQNFSQESVRYMQQLHIWLGVGSAGGAVSMASLAASMKDSNYAFEFLVPSFWSFLVGIVAAGFAILALSKRAESLGSHYASSYNRGQLKQKIDATPENFSKPERLAEEANAPRNDMIRQHDTEHIYAEKAWEQNVFWKKFWLGGMLISSLAFIGGFAWPLIQITCFDRNIVP